MNGAAFAKDSSGLCANLSRLQQSLPGPAWLRLVPSSPSKERRRDSCEVSFRAFTCCPSIPSLAESSPSLRRTLLFVDRRVSRPDRRLPPSLPPPSLYELYLAPTCQHIRKTFVIESVKGKKNAVEVAWRGEARKEARDSGKVQSAADGSFPVDQELEEYGTEDGASYTCLDMTACEEQRRGFALHCLEWLSAMVTSGGRMDVTHPVLSAPILTTTSLDRLEIHEPFAGSVDRRHLILPAPGMSSHRRGEVKNFYRTSTSTSDSLPCRLSFSLAADLRSLMSAILPRRRLESPAAAGPYIPSSVEGNLYWN